MILTQQCYHPFNPRLCLAVSRLKRHQHLIFYLQINYNIKIKKEVMSEDNKDYRQCQAEDINQRMEVEVMTYDQISTQMEKQHLQMLDQESQYTFPPFDNRFLSREPPYRYTPLEQYRQQVFRIEILPPPQANIQNQRENFSSRQHKVLAQNISSVTFTQIGNLLSEGQTKQFKKMVKHHYEQFLEQNCGVSSQLVFIFAYLFLLKNSAVGTVYDSFFQKILKYLEKRQFKSDKIQDLYVRQILKSKIEIQKQLLYHVFRLRGSFISNFIQLKELCVPLFTGTQQKRKEDPFKNAQKIQEEIIALRIYLNSQAQKRSIGCQVEF